LKYGKKEKYRRNGPPRSDLWQKYIWAHTLFLLFEQKKKSESKCTDIADADDIQEPGSLKICTGELELRLSP
jgi:hypothetical protein